MQSFLIRAGFMELLGVAEPGMQAIVAKFPPDVRVGKFLGWKRDQAAWFKEHRDAVGGVQFYTLTREYVGIQAAADLAGMTKMRASLLHKAGRFVAAAVRLEPLVVPEPAESGGEYVGAARNRPIFGWDRKDVLGWARRGDVPVCGRPKVVPPHDPCGAALPRTRGGLAPACRWHLTREELEWLNVGDE